jgi:hypothetical protein
MPVNFDGTLGGRRASLVFPLFAWTEFTPALLSGEIFIDLNLA